MAAAVWREIGVRSVAWDDVPGALPCTSKSFAIFLVVLNIFQTDKNFRESAPKATDEIETRKFKKIKISFFFFFS